MRAGRKERERERESRTGSREAGRFENGTIGRSAKVGGIRRDCLREQGDPWRQTAAACLDLARSFACFGSPLSPRPFRQAMTLSLSISLSLHLASHIHTCTAIHVVRVCTYMPDSGSLFYWFILALGLSFSLFPSLFLFALPAVPPSADDRSKCARLVFQESRARNEKLCLPTFYPFEIILHQLLKRTQIPWTWLIFKSRTESDILTSLICIFIFKNNLFLFLY